MKKHIFSLALFILIVLVLPSGVQGQTPTPPISPEKTTAYNEMLARAHQDGAVQIIVGLNTQFQPEGFISTPQAIQQQQVAIKLAQQNLRDRLAGLQVANVQSFKYIPFMAMSVDETALKTLISDPAVSSIQQDRMNKLHLSESVPLIGGTEAWDQGYSGAGWSVAIVDSGVDSSHSFLQGKVVSEACFSTSKFSSYPSGTFVSVCPNGQDEQIGTGAGVHCDLEDNSCYHGTHVAGIAAGRGNSFSGVARDASIISMQVMTKITNSFVCEQLGHTAPCTTIFDSDIISALERVYALRGAYHIAAVNMSLGGLAFDNQPECDTQNSATKFIIDNLRSVGIPTIVSSGNSGNTDKIGSPGCISTAFSVGSTEDGSGSATVDTVSSFSNSALFLSLLAPGNSIYSSIPNERAATMGGTSMASPHVAGAWAVMKSKAPDASIETIFAALQNSGKMVTDYRNDITKPRIQLDAALKELPDTLQPPSNVQATLSDDGTIALTWTDTNDNESGYTIERQYGGSSWSIIARVGENVQSYTDEDDILCEQQYSYRIAAYTNSNVSEYSNSASVIAQECATPGDCNMDDTIDAGDLSAIALAIDLVTFDSGGCDANNDGNVTVDDIKCTAKMIFGEKCSSQGLQNNILSSPLLPAHTLAVSDSDAIIVIKPISDTQPVTDTVPVSRTIVTIDGPDWGAVMTDYTFTANTFYSSTTGITPTTPITYTWFPEPKEGQGSQQATYHWIDAGVKRVMVTATNKMTTVTTTHTITITTDLYAIAPTTATIEGPVQGLPSQVYTFTAAFSPTNITKPISYTWSPKPLIGQGTLNAIYQWQHLGTETVGFTVANKAGSISTTHKITLAGELAHVALEGPSDGFVDTDYRFTAMVSPSNLLLPVTYRWIPQPDSIQNDTIATYNWDTAGTKTITVAVSNAFEAVTKSHQITLTRLLEQVAIEGLSAGKTHTEYSFVAVATPDDDTLSYLWKPEPLRGQGTKVATYRWDIFGTKSIQVEVTSDTAKKISEPYAFEVASLAFPALTVPNWKTTDANTIVEMPVTFVTEGSLISSIAFSIDYDEKKLIFDHTNPLSVRFANLPSDFTAWYTFDSTDTDGEIDIVITDTSFPLATLSDDSIVATILFTTRTPIIEGALAWVDVTEQPTHSFGSSRGLSVDGSSVNGSVRIAAETRPVIGLPSYVTSQSGEIEIPITFMGNGNDIGSMQFTLDYAQDMISFDGNDTNSDGIPDAITFANGIDGSVKVESSQSDGEISFVVDVDKDVYLPNGLAALPDGGIARVLFNVLSHSAVNPDRVGIRFASQSAPQFFTASGQEVAGIIDGGTASGTYIVVGKAMVYLPMVMK